MKTENTIGAVFMRFFIHSLNIKLINSGIIDNFQNGFHDAQRFA